MQRVGELDVLHCFVQVAGLLVCSMFATRWVVAGLVHWDM